MLKRDEATNPNTCWNKAREDERVFVLLARDAAAPVAIRAWAAERIRLGKNTEEDPQIVEAIDCAARMDAETGRQRIEPTRGVYRYDEDFGRMGSLSGVFIAERSDVEAAMGQTAYLGEVLGKHSEVHAEITADTIKLVTNDPSIVGMFATFGLATGMNPIAALANE